MRDVQIPFHRATVLSVYVILAVQMEEVHYTGFICKLLETKIMQVLRFKHGQVRDIYKQPLGLRGLNELAMV